MRILTVFSFIALFSVIPAVAQAQDKPEPIKVVKEVCQEGDLLMVTFRMLYDHPDESHVITYVGSLGIETVWIPKQQVRIQWWPYGFGKTQEDSWGTAVSALFDEKDGQKTLRLNMGPKPIENCTPTASTSGPKKGGTK